MTTAPDVVQDVPPEVRRAYLDALTGLRGKEAVDVARAAVRGGVPVAVALEQLVAAGQAEVGRRWETNQWSVAHEHAATSISEHVVAALSGEVAPPAQQRGTVVVTCVDGEWHALPARILAVVLGAAGWDTRFLGASTPADHLARLLDDLGPDAVALSCSVATSLPRARRMIEVVRGAGVPVLAGGRGFGPDGRWATALGADAWAASASAAVDLLAAGWPAFTDPAPPPPAPDDEQERIERDLPELVEQAMRLLEQRFPPMRGYTLEQLTRTREDFGHILRFLGAALFVDDPGEFEDFVRWLVGLLGARGVPPVAVSTSLQGLVDVLAGLPSHGQGEGMPRARRFLAAGLAVVPRDPGAGQDVE
jgi:methanogenic corrinoid protein MtbC1